MSRLPLVDPKNARARPMTCSRAVRTKVGRIPNMMKAMANSPAVLEGYLGLSGALAGGSLEPKLRSGFPSRPPRPMAAPIVSRPTTSWASSPVSTRKSAWPTDEVTRSIPSGRRSEVRPHAARKQGQRDRRRYQQGQGGGLLRW